MNPSPYPDEFQVDTSAARPLNAAEALNHLQDIWGMQALLRRVSRTAYELKCKAEDQNDAEQKKTREVIKTTVTVIDELRRLVEDARRNLAELEAPAAAPEPTVPATPAPLTDAPAVVATVVVPPADPAAVAVAPAVAALNPPVAEDPNTGGFWGWIGALLRPQASQVPTEAIPPQIQTPAEEAASRTDLKSVPQETTDLKSVPQEGRTDLKSVPQETTDLKSVPQEGRTDLKSVPQETTDLKSVPQEGRTDLKSVPQDDSPPPLTAAQVAREWFDAFGRLVTWAIRELESRDVYHVPLIGEDLRTAKLEDGQAIKRWVAVKNQATDGRLVVAKEIRGLWVARWGGKLIPVQNGEVLVS